MRFSLLYRVTTTLLPAVIRPGQSETSTTVTVHLAFIKQEETIVLADNEAIKKKKTLVE